jgi:hypothetical protein
MQPEADIPTALFVASKLIEDADRLDALAERMEPGAERAATLAQALQARNQATALIQACDEDEDDQAG